MSSAPKISASRRATKPVPLDQVLGLAPYVQGKCEIDSTEEPMKLSSNECCFGPSPKAVSAYESVAEKLHRYADGSQRELREAIAEAHGTGRSAA